MPRSTIKGPQDGAITFNEGSADVDFRVESNGEANMLFVDGGNDRVGIGTTGGSGETLTVTKSGADATVRINGVASQEAALKLQGNNTATNTFKIASEQDDTGLTIQKWNGSAYVPHIASDANGHVTMPLQSAFSVTESGSQANIATQSTVHLLFDTEVFDVNGDFSSNTFTAPVTGKYQLSINIPISALDNGATFYYSEIATSNRRYLQMFDMNFSGDLDYKGFGLSLLVDMDANDTAQAKIYQHGGSNQSSVNNDAEFNHFTGFLVC